FLAPVRRATSPSSLTTLFRSVLGLFEQRVREARLVLVDLFRGELGEHAAQVALQGLLGDLHELLARLAQEALDRVVEQRLLPGRSEETRLNSSHEGSSYAVSC